MLKALLLAYLAASPALSEWVEISQQHYRKPVTVRANVYHQEPEDEYGSTAEESTQPIHNFNKEDPVRFTSNNPKDPVRPTYTENVRIKPNFPEIDKEIIYTNLSLSEHSLNQKSNTVPDSIKRVDTKHSQVKANITPEFSLEIYEPAADLPVLVTRNRPHEQQRVPATVERVHNKGNVKRVELYSTPVKSPSLTNSVPTSSPTRKNDIRKYGTTPLYDDSSDEFEIKSDILQKPHKEVASMTPINDVKYTSTPTKETPFRNYDTKTRIKSTTSSNLPISETQTPFQKYLPIKKPDDRKETENKENDFIKNIFPVDNKHRYVAENDKNKDILQKNSLKHTNANERNINKDNPSSVKNNEPKIQDVDFEEVSINSNRPKQNFSPPNIDTQYTKNQNKKANKDANKGSNKTTAEIKINTMENILKFLKVVADTISRNTRKGVNGKVKYLHELKDTLLSSIKDRIDATWPDDDTSARTRRRSRSASATARGHVEFPSSESALMTISFLTFAVFLIKLVLQVIQTYKSKTMMMAPLVVATAGRTVKKLRTVH